MVSRDAPLTPPQWDRVVELLPLLHAVAAKLGRRARFWVDDLAGVGLWGLIDAVRRWDHARGVRIETWATIRIRSVVLDYLRDRGSKAGSRSRRLRRVRRDSAFFDSVLAPASTGPAALADATDLVDTVLSPLPPRLARILRLRYIDGLLLREIGDAIGVTEARVCVQESDALASLREIWAGTSVENVA